MEKALQKLNNGLEALMPKDGVTWGLTAEAISDGDMFNIKSLQIIGTTGVHVSGTKVIKQNPCRKLVLSQYGNGVDLSHLIKAMNETRDMGAFHEVVTISARKHSYMYEVEDIAVEAGALLFKQGRCLDAEEM